VRGFKYPWTRAWLDIVRAHWTLSGHAEHCLNGPEFVWLGLSVQEGGADWRFSENDI
jgi:hypothetical protein